MSPIKIAYASGKNTNVSMTLKELSFEQLSQWFEDPQEGEKNTVGYFIRGGDMILTDEGTETEHYHRNNDSLISADLLVLDIDKGSVTPQEMHEQLKKLNFKHIIYTSPSHTKELPRYRVIFICRMPNESYLKPSLSKFRQLLDLDAKPSAGEEGNWSNPWYLPIRTPDYHFLTNFSGNEVTAVRPSEVSENSEIGQKSLKPDSKRTSRNQIQTIVEGVEGSGLHECIENFIWGQLKDGVAPTTVGHIFEVFTRDWPDDEYHRRYTKDITRTVKSTAKKLKREHRTDWEDIIPIPLLPTLSNDVKFPVEYAPESLKASAKAIADFNSLDESDIYLVLIGVISASINRKAQIEVGTAYSTESGHPVHGKPDSHST